jgi:thioredoxin-like negative regulator of GroEL
MKKSVFLIILMFSCALSAAAKDLTYLSTEDFKKKVCYYDKSSKTQWKYLGDKPCLIDFSTTWCGWCKKLHPILEQIAEQYDGQIYVYTLDADKEPELAALFAVSGYPTVVLCPMKGTPQKVAGYNPLEFWQEAILQVFGIAKP